MEIGDLKGIAIYCPTEGLAITACNLAHQLGWKWCDGRLYCDKTDWSGYNGGTCYYFADGDSADLGYAQKEGVKIKSAEWFLDNFTSKEEKPNVFVYIRGVEGRGEELLNILKELGGTNGSAMAGDKTDCLYYINGRGHIDCDPESISSNWMKTHYTEIFLPEQKEEPKYTFKPFDKVLVRDEEDFCWKIELFSHYDKYSEYPYYCIGDNHHQCIPYEGNEHLLGTSNNV